MEKWLNADMVLFILCVPLSIIEGLV